MFSFLSLKSSGHKLQPDYVKAKNETANYHFRVSHLLLNLTHYVYPLTGFVSFASLLNVAAASRNSIIKYFEGTHNVTYQVHFNSFLQDYMDEVAHNFTNSCLLEEPEKTPITYHLIQSIGGYAELYASQHEIEETVKCMVNVINGYIDEIDKKFHDEVLQKTKELGIAVGSIFGAAATLLILMTLARQLYLYCMQRRENEVMIEELPENQRLLNAEENPISQQANNDSGQIQLIVEEEQQDIYTKYRPDVSKLLKERIDLLENAELFFREEFSFNTDKKAIDNNYICPVSHSVMADPFIANDGYHYSEEALNQLKERNMLKSVFNINQPITTYFLDNHFKQKIECFVAKKEKELIALLDNKKAVEKGITLEDKEDQQNSFKNTFNNNHSFFSKREESMPLSQTTSKRRNSF